MQHFTSNPESNIIDFTYVDEFFHQIAGHTNEKVRRYRENCILKPRIKVDLFDREVKFYEDIFGSNVTEQIEFLAKYFGVVYLLNENNNNKDSVTLLPHIVLSDLTLGYRNPCVIDIKMGRQTFEPTASREKKDREIKKYPHQHEIGFRITGLKVWDEKVNMYHYKNKAFGRSIIPEQVVQALAFFFQNGIEIRTDVISGLIPRLKGLLKWMKVQNRYKFYCSSILVVYDGSKNYADETDICRFAMIDFAHVIASDEVDHDYVYGLENLIAKLQVILDITNSNDSDISFQLMSAVHDFISK